ncbi:MAG TPA: two-component regulator propeller domain-containing protein [Candidatus Kapabacteria bacterium]|nr:two-component regulator propeller domain-containing protein [Candidatus Kapabacteria bacterium]
MKKFLFFFSVTALNFLTINTSEAQDGVWKTYSRANSGLIGDSVSSIGFDGNDSLWVAVRQGVAKQTSSGWKAYNTQVEIPSNEIWDIDYTNGSMWFAHHNGVTGFDGSTWKTYTTTNSGLINSPVLHLAHDGQSNLWIGTARGLCRLSPDNSWTSYKHENTPAIPYDGIESITTGQSNTLWMSFIGTAGLVVFPAGSSANAKYIKQDSIPNFPKGPVYIKCLATDWNGNLWAGTNKYGVIRINATGATVFSQQNISAIKNDTIHTVAVDHCGNVWVGSEKGVSMFDGSAWTSISTSTGQLPNDYVYTIEVDASGHVWFGTKGGVTEFKPLPKAVTLLSPGNSAIIENDSVISNWEWDCPNILKYWHEIADNAEFANSKIDTTSASLTESAHKLNINLANSTTYYWRVKAKTDAGWGPFSSTWTFSVNIPSSVEMGNMMSSQCSMMQNYPNPCSDRTTIEFSVPKHQHVTLSIFDMLGRSCKTVMDDVVGPGKCTMSIDLNMIQQNGLYIYRLKVGETVLQRMMHVVR